MARTSPLHWIGVTFLFIAFILLLVTSISAPVIPDIAILKVLLSNSSDIRRASVTFGSFGHCVLDVAPVTTDQDYCYPRSIGYKPADVMATIDGKTPFPSLVVNQCPVVEAKRKKKKKGRRLILMNEKKRHRVQQSSGG